MSDVNRTNTVDQTQTAFGVLAGQRPPWCQDPTCTRIAMSPWDSLSGPGDSGFCCGSLPDPRVLESHGVVHTNDHHFCFRSPRGVVMTEVNLPDLQLIARLALRALVAAEPKRTFNWRWFTGRSGD